MYRQQPLYKNPRGNGTVFTFALSYKSEARDMVTQLPAYLAFKHTNNVLEYFSATKQARAKDEPWENILKCLHSATDTNLDNSIRKDYYAWNTKAIDLLFERIQT